MQCNCGGTTIEHKVVENKATTQTFQQCTACGRVGWRRYFVDDGFFLLANNRLKVTHENP